MCENRKTNKQKTKQNPTENNHCEEEKDLAKLQERAFEQAQSALS